MITVQTNKLARCLLGVTGAALIGIQSPVVAGEDQKYPYTGNCASLGADRTTEFHGNPERAELLLGMAGNQWVVFDRVMRDFNLYRGLDPAIPANQANYTLEDLAGAFHQANPLIGRNTPLAAKTEATKS